MPYGEYVSFLSLCVPTAFRSQVTAMCVSGENLYIGVSCGHLLVLDASTLAPVILLSCHEGPLKYLIPVATPPHHHHLLPAGPPRRPPHGSTRPGRHPQVAFHSPHPRDPGEGVQRPGRGICQLPVAVQRAGEAWMVHATLEHGVLRWGTGGSEARRGWHRQEEAQGYRCVEGVVGCSAERCECNAVVLPGTHRSARRMARQLQTHGDVCLCEMHGVLTEVKMRSSYAPPPQSRLRGQVVQTTNAHPESSKTLFENSSRPWFAKQDFRNEFLETLC